MKGQRRDPGAERLAPHDEADRRADRRVCALDETHGDRRADARPEAAGGDRADCRPFARDDLRPLARGRPPVRAAARREAGVGPSASAAGCARRPEIRLRPDAASGSTRRGPPRRDRRFRRVRGHRDRAPPRAAANCARRARSEPRRARPAGGGRTSRPGRPEGKSRSRPRRCSPSERRRSRRRRSGRPARS